MIKKWVRFLVHRRILKSRNLIRMGIILAYLLILTFFLPQNYHLRMEYEVGKAWQDPDLYAPFDFAIKKLNDSITAEKIQVAEDARKIFTTDTIVKESVSNQVEARWNELLIYLRNYKEAEQRKDEVKVEEQQIEGYFSGRYNIEVTQLLDNLSLNRKNPLVASAQKLVDRVYLKGYINYPAIDSLRDFITIRNSPTRAEYVPVQKLLHEGNLSDYLEESVNLTNPVQKQLLLTILIQELKPNLIYNEKLTLAEIDRVQSLVSPVYGKIRKDELIIQKGQRIDRETDRILQSLQSEKEKRYGEEDPLYLFLSQFLVVFLITLLLLVYLRLIQPRIYFNYIQLSSILFTFLLVVGGMVLATNLANWVVQFDQYISQDLTLDYIYLAPACIAPIFISNFFDSKTAFLCNILVALYGAVLVQQGLEYVYTQIIAGSIAVYSLRRLRKRKAFFYSLAYIFAGYVLAHVSFNLLAKGGVLDFHYNNLILFGINVLLTLITFNLVYVYERLFGITSDLTYLELLDTNHPLLQQLSRKAPGTFQHSLQVANIAEATVNVIGGNALLTHVGALYHDIGKMTHPGYFIENMVSGENNPHHNMSCQESAEIIIGHVQEGIEMAERAKLPPEVIHFIETHHGTTRVEYFYRKYLAERNCEAPEGEDLFRYKGPLPFSKETAVLMIADSVEAASRALKKPSPKDLENLINTIIDRKIYDKQLENSTLTFKDISAIRDVIYKQLISIHHVRLEYPKEAMEPV